jgi:DNA-binding GntR family transcriptional regulator
MIRAQNLRKSVADTVREMVIRQEIDPTRSVGETALSERLGFCRTPVREALLELERQGLVSSRRGYGFVVTPLNLREAREVYPMIWSLESLALAQSGPISKATANKLRRLNQDLATAQGAYDRVTLDSRWHTLLISECRNRRLVTMVDELKQTVRRYEYAYLKVAGLKEKSTLEHDAIVEAFGSDPKHAADLLERHWREGMREVITMFEEGHSI